MLNPLYHLLRSCTQVDIYFIFKLEENSWKYIKIKPNLKDLLIFSSKKRKNS